MANTGNSNLHKSRSGRQDEFYTQLSTIEDELSHYKEYFKDKIVFCNCDDPAIGIDGQDHYGDGNGGYTSEFYRYFKIYFGELGIKKLITTHYDPNKPTYKVELTSADGEPVTTPLKQNGDFRSPECMALLEEADIVVTNPPFSKMREYLPLLVKSGKQFIVLGNMNHATYVENFIYFLQGKVWLGYNSGHFWFKVPDYYEVKNTDFKIDENGQKWRRLGNICWFTNIYVEKRHEPLVLYKKYKGKENEYPMYDNFEAIHVKKVADIPRDYDGIIGVPITYLASHCDEQFDIVGELKHGCDSEYDLVAPCLNGKSVFTRIAIRNKNPQTEEEEDEY